MTAAVLPLLAVPLPPPPADAAPPRITPPPPPPLPLRCILRCAALRHDRRAALAAHALAVKSGCFSFSSPEASATPLCNAVLSAYASLSSLPSAVAVFRQIPSPDVASYSILISALAKLSPSPFPAALRLFASMRLAGIPPNGYALVALLTACSRCGDIRLGRQVHALALKHHGFPLPLPVGNALLGVYVKCGCLDDAVMLFDGMPERDVSSWNALLLGWVDDGRCSEAAEMFAEMRRRGVEADGISLSVLLKCGHDAGEAVHSLAVKCGLELDLSVGNALIGFYATHGTDAPADAVDIFERMPAKDVISWTGLLTAFMGCGMVESAAAVFDRMPERNLATYNALLSGFSDNRDGIRGLKLFRRMLEEGLEISDSTMTAALNCCALLADWKASESVHAFLIKCGCGTSSWVDAALVDMCAKCGRNEDSHRIFDRWIHDSSSRIALTSLLIADARDGEFELALRNFISVFKNDGIMLLDEFMAATVLDICSSLGFLDIGRQMHCLAVKFGVSSDIVVENAIVSMYGECGNLRDSVRAFTRMADHDIVSWNTLMMVHLLHRKGNTVLDLWGRMKDLNVKPDAISFAVIISAYKCTGAESVEACFKLFNLIMSSYGIAPTMQHYAAMVDVLSFWGHFDKAESLIEAMPFEPDASVWRSLLNNCRFQSNTTLGERATRQLLMLEPHDPSTYILASNLYSAMGRWHCSERLRQDMRLRALCKIPARCWTVHCGKVHSFYSRDWSHLLSKDIYAALELLIQECLRTGYQPDTSYVRQEVEECQKRSFLFYHSAKLAVAHGILTVPPGKTITAVKNVRLCGDCHSFIKQVSSVTGREIMIRDPGGFHIFKNGHCCCTD